MKKHFKIREATIEDVGVILRFIREFAEHGGVIENLVATEEKLREFLFGVKSYAEVILGEVDNKPVAYALFTHNFSTLLGQPGMYLVDLYVTPEARNKKIGHFMLAHLAQLAKERNCGRFEWSVLKTNTSAITFYEKLGAKPLNDWITYRVTGQELDALALENIDSYLTCE